MAEQQLRIFVSHSHQDNTFCHAIVQALREAGADVWYDEQSMTSGQLGPVIERELEARPVFVVVLSPAALQSSWVEDECRWAYALYRADRTRTILPILAAPVESENAFWLFLREFKRVEAADLRPYPVEEAANHLVRALALTPRGEAPTPIAPQPTESYDDLITRAAALFDQNKHAEAQPLLERATQLEPHSWSAWAVLGVTLGELGRYQEALTAYERALSLNQTDASVWNRTGVALMQLERYQEALAAFERALALNPKYGRARVNRDTTLVAVRMVERHAKWTKAEESVAANERTLALNPQDAEAWHNKAVALRVLARTDEADEAERRAKKLGWKG